MGRVTQNGPMDKSDSSARRGRTPPCGRSRAADARSLLLLLLLLLVVVLV